MKYNIKSALMSGLLTMVIVAADAQVLPLDSVLRIIDRQNLMLAEDDNRINALEAYASGARSWPAPMVGAGTFMMPYRTQSMMHEGDRGAWMLSLEQEIPNPAKVHANEQYLMSRAGVAKEGRSARLNNLREEARTSYYRWLVAAEKLRVLTENEKIIDLMLRLAWIRYPYNQGSLGDIYKAEASLAEIRNMIIMTRSDIETASHALRALMALPASFPIAIDTTTTVLFKPDRVILDTLALGGQRSDIRQIDQSIRVMRLSRQLQRVQVKPDFKFRFDHMQPVGNMPGQFTAMAMMSIPIAPWSSKMYKAEIKGMQYEIEAMKRSREGALIEIRGKLAGLANQITRMEEHIENYDAKIIPALEKNFRTLMIAYEENREQLPGVIDAWEALNMAHLDHLGQIEAYYTMIANYEKEVEK